MTALIALVRKDLLLFLGDRRAHLLSNAIYYRDVSNEKN